MPNEKQTDFIISRLLENADINFFPNGSNVYEIQNALSTASKRGTNKTGFPEFTAVVKNFVIVIEDKAETRFQSKYLGENTLLMDEKSIVDYAENGALHYALKIIQSSNFKKIIAFGCSGVDEKKILIRPIFVSPNGYKIMQYEKNFLNFSEQNIDRYYSEKICGNKPIEQVELEDIISHSKELHEDLRNFGQLGDTEKPRIVSGILLALQDSDFSTEKLSDINEKKSDGKKIYRAISDTLDKLEVEPSVKKDQLLTQFSLIENRPYLSQIDPKLGKSPLKFFAEYIDSNVITAIVNNSPEDVLGRFYSEFIRYSGGDGQSLGVVLTPRHIAELFCDLAQIKPTDKVFDPCCGTATFLIAAMNKMLQLAKTDDEKLYIKKHQLHGIELRDDMFSIATTNMILRGDGKSNLRCEDFLKIPAEDLQRENFTVGLMNPPYSQAKKKVTAHLSELKFISHLLDSLGENARCVVIVPQSTMVGKTSEDKSDKKYILENHTLEGVITLNPQTFYGIGTNPVIAVFTAHKPHDPKKLVKFIDFKNDGYEVFPHIGLLATPQAPDRKKFLLQCWHEGQSAPNNFIIRTEIKFDDEWLHSFYYFNEEIPTETDFEKTMADYLSFEFNMIVHGRGYLFSDEKKNSVTEKNLPSLDSKIWKDFLIKDLFEISSGKCAQANRLEKIANGIPYVGATNRNNGVLEFVKPVEKFIQQGNCIAFIKQGEGSVGYAIYKAENFIAATSIALGYAKFLNRYTGTFITTISDQVRGQYSYNYPRSEERLKREKIMLPVDDQGNPDFEFMENYMRRIEEKLLNLYLEKVSVSQSENILRLSGKVWKPFLILDIFENIQRGKRLKTSDHLIGNEPYVSSSAENNGVDGFIGNEKSVREFENCLTIANSGSVGKSFYHCYKFIASDHVTMLSSEKLNKWNYLFISRVLDRLKENYSFNREINDRRIKQEKIMLPVDDNGNPDFDFMEKYMRAQENLLLKKYLDQKLSAE